MRIYAIGDLHLSHANPKPMGVFGAAWNQHWEKICANWWRLITAEDVVLIPGDISWAMKLSDAVTDLNSIAELPGKKIIMRGNHDYWWNSLAKVSSVLPASMIALQNDCVDLGEVVVCGSRGWLCKGSSGFKEEDEKIYNRELVRLELSLSKAAGKNIIAMTHYPPFNERQEESGFSLLYQKYSVSTAIYGHLHGRSCEYAFEGALNGTQYNLVSCDHLDFCPKLIWQC